MKKNILGKIANIIDDIVEKNIMKNEQNNKPRISKKRNKTYDEKITVKQIAEHFQTTQININNALIKSSLAEQKGKWWIATAKGIKAGAEQKYNAKTKQKYILWSKRILINEEIIGNIEIKPKRTSYKEKVIKGKQYEEYVAKYYTEKGYTVWEHGKDKGRKDGGIDLIVKKDRELILIQCKNWQEDGKWKITHEHIKRLRTEGRDIVEDNPIFKSYESKVRFTISGNFIHNSAIKYIEEAQKKGKHVDYEILKMEN